MKDVMYMKIEKIPLKEAPVVKEVLRIKGEVDKEIDKRLPKEVKEIQRKITELPVVSDIVKIIDEVKSKILSAEVPVIKL